VLEQNATHSARLHGTFRNAGSVEVTVSVQDAQNCAQVTLPINVSETPIITTVFPDTCAGAPFQLDLTASGGEPEGFTWTYEGDVPLSLEAGRLYGTAPSTPGEYPVRLTLRDGTCPLAGTGAMMLDAVWTVRAGGVCPTIATASLPAPCAGIAYSQALEARDGSGEGYLWSAVSSQLPDGLEFDAERGVVHGTPTGLTREGSLEVQLTDSRGRRAIGSLDVSLRDNCRIAWVADEPPRLHIGDVYLSNAGFVLPRALPPEASVRDLRFSPDGAWIAFRAGPSGGERLHLFPMQSSALSDSTVVDFLCPEGPECPLLDYAWSRDSRHLAVVLGGSDRDFVSGVSVVEQGPLLPWPVVGTAVVNGSSELPLDYVRDLSWSVDDSFGFVGASGNEATPHTVFAGSAGLAEVPRSTGYYDSDVRLRQIPSGWVAFDAFFYATTALVPPDGMAVHPGAWASPSGSYVARTSLDGQLSVYAMANDLEPLASTEIGSCPVVVAWAPAAEGVERIVCGSGTVDTPDGNALRMFDFDAQRLVLDPPLGRAVPLNGAYIPSLLNNTRRFFSPSADWLVLGQPAEGIALLPIPRGTPGLPRAFAVLSVTAPAELGFTPDGRSLIVYDQNELRRIPVPPGLDGSRLSFDESGPIEPPPNLTTCEEAVWASPDNWCGAPQTRAHFSVSQDSTAALFEATAGLWLADLLSPGRPARRVASSVPSCGAPCPGLSYAFQP
jgi:hypothetical protein